MTHSSALALSLSLALSSFAVLAGCSADAPKEDDPASGAPNVSGVYAANGDGPVSRIILAEGQYSLRKNGCGDASCDESGTYSFDAARESLTLTHDGRSETLPFAVVTSGNPGGASSQGLVKPKGLCIVGETCAGDTPTLILGESKPLPKQEGILIQCTGNCAITIKVNGQELTTTGQSLTVTVPPENK